jgi:hypothetical protein
MTLYGPSIPIRVQPAGLPDPAVLAEREPAEPQDCQPAAAVREPAAAVCEPAAEPASAAVSWSGDERV